jgi:hypothetical protein
MYPFLPFLGFWIGFGFVPGAGCVPEVFDCKEMVSWCAERYISSQRIIQLGTTLLFSGDTINILGGEDQNSQWCKAYSYYSSPSAQNEVIWTSGIARATCVPEVFSCKEVVSWSPSTQNEVIWTSGIARAGCVPEVFDCKEVVSWCAERPISSQRIIPLRNHSLVSLSPQVFHKMLRLSQPTLTFRGEDCKEFLKKHDNQFCMHVQELVDASCMLSH